MILPTRRQILPIVGVSPSATCAASTTPTAGVISPASDEPRNNPRSQGHLETAPPAPR